MAGQSGPLGQIKLPTPYDLATSLLVVSPGKLAQGLLRAPQEDAPGSNMCVVGRWKQSGVPSQGQGRAGKLGMPAMECHAS